MGANHDLKVWPEYYFRIKDGTKTFEVRKDDRNFKVGDTIRFKEFIPESRHETSTADSEYTGNECCAEIVYKLDGGKFGIDPGYCVMGIKLLK